MRKEKRRADPPAAGQPFAVRLKRDLRRHWFAYFIFIPVLVWYIVFHYLPMYGVLIAFKDYKPLLGFSGSKWVGLKNFMDYFNSPFFLRTVKNTLMQNLWGLAVGFPAPIILALSLNEVRSAGFKRVVQTITYMPHFISLVVACGIVRLFVASNGPITQLLNMITGTEHTSLLSYAGMYRPIYALSGVWQGIGWGSIIYLSAMSSVDPELYEAAEIDGAGRFARMWHITIPCILPTIMLLLIRDLGGMMGSGYQKTILLYNSLTYETADTIGSYVYRRGLVEGSYGFSSAVGLFSTLINFALLLIANRASRKLTETSLF